MPDHDAGESVLISMGSNIEPEVNLPEAIKALMARTRVVAVSRVFETDPVADRPMSAFLNAAVEIITSLEPVRLKYRVLREIESLLGRVRQDDRNAPRTIDLDIALFGTRVVNDAEESIVIPDPEILSCAHVALPLADVAPERRHPVTGRSLAEIAAGFHGDEGVRPAAKPGGLIGIVLGVSSPASD